MSDVFVLGAGFSKAIHTNMPTLPELSKEVEARLGSPLPSPLNRLGNNIELWLTYLSQPHPWLKEYDNLKNKALFLQMTERLGEVLSDRTKEVVVGPRPNWLFDLIDYWDGKKSRVITFNYDTLIERAAVTSSKHLERIYPIRLTDVRRASTFGAGPGESFHLLKLHGSVNWYYSGAPSYQGEVLYLAVVEGWGAAVGGNEAESLLAARDKLPLIVPPTTEKVSYFQHESIRQVWFQASQAIQAAERVHMVGYSLPETDLGVRFLLHHSSQTGKKHLLLVNRGSDKEGANLVGHYQCLLGDGYQVDGSYAKSGAEQWAIDLVQGKI